MFGVPLTSFYKYIAIDTPSFVKEHSLNMPVLPLGSTLTLSHKLLGFNLEVENTGLQKSILKESIEKGGCWNAFVTPSFSLQGLEKALGKFCNTCFEKKKVWQVLHK